MKCLESNDKMPDYIRANPGNWLKSDMESCCENYYNWAKKECIVGSGGTPSSTGTGQWYVDWILHKVREVAVPFPFTNQIIFLTFLSLWSCISSVLRIARIPRTQIAVRLSFYF